MRELSEIKRSGALVDALLADHALFHLEADLRWIDVTTARLGALAEMVRPHDRRRPSRAGPAAGGPFRRPLLRAGRRRCARRACR
ncbi:hypothetical protein [Nonomuraea dietziae]|uniref:hypothetical protein n=1 Tax=Nonomuraea dietziae TaxID=65515 RepID=UPI00337A837A